MKLKIFFLHRMYLCVLIINLKKIDIIGTGETSESNNTDSVDDTTASDVKIETGDSSEKYVNTTTSGKTNETNLVGVSPAKRQLEMQQCSPCHVASIVWQFVVSKYYF